MISYLTPWVRLRIPADATSQSPLEPPSATEVLSGACSINHCPAMRRWVLSELRSYNEDPTPLTQGGYPQPVQVVPLPQLLLESQRVELVADLLVALPDQVRVEVHVMVHVHFLLWLLSRTWRYTSEVALRIWLVLTRSSSSRLEFDRAESEEICYSYNPTFGHAEIGRRVRNMDSLSKVGSTDSRCGG